MSRALPEHGDLVKITGGYSLNGPLEECVKGALGRIEEVALREGEYDGPCPKRIWSGNCRLLYQTGTPGVRILECSNEEWVGEILMLDLLTFRVLSTLERLAYTLTLNEPCNPPTA